MSREFLFGFFFGVVAALTLMSLLIHANCQKRNGFAFFDKKTVNAKKKFILVQNIIAGIANCFASKGVHGL